MFPKKGSFLLDSRQYAQGIAQALHAELGSTHQAVKTLMKWTDASEKTVKNWLGGVNGPRGEHLIALVQHSDVILNVVLLMAQRRSAMVSTALPALRRSLMETLAVVDAYLSDLDGKI
ncbi:MAG: hypothetical protein WCA48_22190 [Pseudomonas gingeri]